jgi:hypothetical protein
MPLCNPTPPRRFRASVRLRLFVPRSRVPLHVDGTKQHARNREKEKPAAVALFLGESGPFGSKESNCCDSNTKSGAISPQTARFHRSQHRLPPAILAAYHIPGIIPCINILRESTGIPTAPSCVDDGSERRRTNRVVRQRPSCDWPRAGHRPRQRSHRWWRCAGPPARRSPAPACPRVRCWARHC